MERKGVSGFRFWTMLWGLGLAGQLCWNVENQWFNTFIYSKIAKDSTIVTLMVIVSALVTTISTFYFGTLSDRRGSRRRFISIGYIAWGVFTIVFGFTEFIHVGDVGNTQKMMALAAVLVILTDSVMSFFGSMGNDSGYSAWTNDMTTDRNRGQIGAVLAMQPVVGTIVGTVLGGMLVGREDNYQRLFWVMGGFVIVVGILSLLFLRDAETLRPHVKGSMWEQFSAIFRVGDMLKRRELLLACLTTAVFFISFNVYFVHMGNFIIYYLGFTADNMGLIQGGSLLIAMLVEIPAIKIINMRKSPALAAFAIVLNFLGLQMLFFAARPNLVDSSAAFALKNLPLFFGVILVGAGYILILQTMTMWVKELYPKDNRGQFEGLRVLFFTLLPMIVGTIIGNIVVKYGAGSIVNEHGVTENIPTEGMYLVAEFLVLFALIPLYFAAKRYRARVGGKRSIK